MIRHHNIFTYLVSLYKQCSGYWHISDLVTLWALGSYKLWISKSHYTFTQPFPLTLSHHVLT